MSVDNIQRQRFEHKYKINEQVALRIRDFVSSYLSLDSYGATQPDFSYAVHSLYLDSPALRTYQETINGDRNRYKLRIRYYEDSADSPVYLEIKRRYDKVIAKKRAVIRRSEVAGVLRGYLPARQALVHATAEQLDALQSFSRLVNHLHATPKVHVAYRREAWILDGENKIRVTMDRNVCSEPQTELSFSTRFRNPRPVFGKEIILELKFNNRYPNWFRDLVQVFGLRQGGAAKYVDGITNMGEFRLMRPAG